MKSKLSKIVTLVLAFAAIISITLDSCGSNDPEMGIGPVSEVKLDASLNQDLVNKGKQIFEMKCIQCHKFDEKLVGPPLSGVTKRRKPEWIMNMILNPDQMLKENMIAKTLLTQYLTPMTFQNVTQDDARAILEYFRSLDK